MAAGVRPLSLRSFIFDMANVHLSVLFNRLHIPRHTLRLRPHSSIPTNFLPYAELLTMGGTPFRSGRHGKMVGLIGGVRNGGIDSSLAERIRSTPPDKTPLLTY